MLRWVDWPNRVIGPIEGSGEEHGTEIRVENLDAQKGVNGDLRALEIGVVAHDDPHAHVVVVRDSGTGTSARHRQREGSCDEGEGVAMEGPVVRARRQQCHVVVVGDRGIERPVQENRLVDGIDGNRRIGDRRSVEGQALANLRVIGQTVVGDRLRPILGVTSGIVDGTGLDDRDDRIIGNRPLDGPSGGDGGRGGPAGRRNDLERSVVASDHDP